MLQSFSIGENSLFPPAGSSGSLLLLRSAQLQVSRRGGHKQLPPVTQVSGEALGSAGRASSEDGAVPDRAHIPGNGFRKVLGAGRRSGGWLREGGVPKGLEVSELWHWGCAGMEIWLLFLPCAESFPGSKFCPGWAWHQQDGSGRWDSCSELGLCLPSHFPFSLVGFFFPWML